MRSYASLAGCGNLFFNGETTTVLVFCEFPVPNNVGRSCTQSCMHNELPRNPSPFLGDVVSMAIAVLSVEVIRTGRHTELLHNLVDLKLEDEFWRHAGHVNLMAFLACGANTAYNK